VFVVAEDLVEEKPKLRLTFGEQPTSPLFSFRPPSDSILFPLRSPYPYSRRHHGSLSRSVEGFLWELELFRSKSASELARRARLRLIWTFYFSCLLLLFFLLPTLLFLLLQCDRDLNVLTISGRPRWEERREREGDER